MILKQTFKNHIILFEFTVVVNLMILAGWWYFSKDIEAYCFGAGLYNLFLTVPSIYLHWEYTRINQGEEIEINHGEVMIRKGGKERKYSSHDLEKIIIYKSASLDRWGMPLSAIEYYHYIRLVTKTDEEIIITCLMSPKIDTEIRKLSGVPCERKKRFFCTLGWR